MPPYYDFRFSNGPVWVESFPTNDLRDYSYGGAVVNQSASNNGPPSLMAQVNDYLISYRFNISTVADETLYIFWGGSNDVSGAPLSNDTLTAQGVNGNLAAMAVDLPLLTASQIRKLVTAGATNILVMLLPSWGNAPVIAQSFSSIQRQVLSRFTLVVNEGIKTNVSAVVKHGVMVKIFDVVEFIQRILDNPGQYGLVNVTHPCLENWELFISGKGGEEPNICGNPDEFLFWDGEHPTAKAHAMLGSEVMRFLGWQ